MPQINLDGAGQHFPGQYELFSGAKRGRNLVGVIDLQAASACNLLRAKIGYAGNLLVTAEEVPAIEPHTGVGLAAGVDNLQRCHTAVQGKNSRSTRNCLCDACWHRRAKLSPTLVGVRCGAKAP